MDNKLKADLNNKQYFTAKDLIKKKEIFEKRKEETLELEVKDVGIFKFRVPTFEDLEDSKAYRRGEFVDEFLITTCSIEPNLKDPELLKAFEVSEAVDLLPKIFKPGETYGIAVKLLDASGYGDETVRAVDVVKN